MTPPSDAPELDRLPRWVPPLVFAVLTLVAFRAYLLAPAGAMLVGQDTIAAGVMMRSFFVDQFQLLGRLPLWNPYLYGGVPTIEAGSGDILYPLSFLLHMALPLTQALAWKLIVHVFLAGCFMYLCARAYGATRLVALFAGTAWLLSANLVSLVFGGQDGKMYVITLFPAGLGLLVAALDRPSVLRFLWLGAVAGLMLIAHPQLAYYAYAALGGYAAVALLARRTEGAPALLRRLGGGALALAVALSVAAMVLLPMYRYLRADSPRAGAGRGLEYSASYSLHPEELVNFVVPDFSGADDGYWGRNPLKHNSEYGGVVVLALGLAGLIGLTGDRRRWGLAAMAGLALVYALGTTTPVFRLMYLAIPGLKNFRAPSLATFVALTAVTLLAVLLLERVLRDRAAAEGRTAVRALLVMAGIALALGLAVQVGGAGALGPWFAIFGRTPRAGALEANLPAMALGGLLAAIWCGVAAAAVAAWRRGMLGPTGLVVTLTVVTAVDLLRVDARYVQTAPYAQFFPQDAGFEGLRQQLQPGERVLPLPGVLQGGGPEGGYLATYRIPEVFGYHGNQLRWYDQLTRRDQRDAARTNEEAQAYWLGFLQSPALRALAARIVLLPGKVSLPGYELIGSNEQVAIYRNTGALSGATIVPAVQIEPDSTRLLARLWEPGFDPGAVALVQGPVPGLDTGGGTGSARITGEGADTLAIEATTSGPALLLVSRTWHPSWGARVDGQPVDPVRVDHALIGVPLAAAGGHQVTLAYRPDVVAESRTVSLLAWAAVLLLTLGIGGAGLRRERLRG